MKPALEEHHNMARITLRIFSVLQGHDVLTAWKSILYKTLCNGTFKVHRFPLSPSPRPSWDPCRKLPNWKSPAGAMWGQPRNCSEIKWVWRKNWGRAIGEVQLWPQVGWEYNLTCTLLHFASKCPLLEDQKVTCCRGIRAKPLALSKSQKQAHPARQIKGPDNPTCWVFVFVKQGRKNQAESDIEQEIGVIVVSWQR